MNDWQALALGALTGIGLALWLFGRTGRGR